MNSDSFWCWQNHIFLKVIGGAFLGAFLIETGVKFLILIGALLDMAVACYGIYVLVRFIGGCFTILPNLPQGKEILDNEKKKREKLEKDVQEYGTIDFYDTDK